jgi:DNA-binding transcriptional regulator GbsR (MarR family)
MSEPTQDEFIEDVGQYLSALGVPRMAGRMWAWLLLTDPEPQSAQQIAERLRASRGAVSGAARVLTATALIRRSRRAGDRREFYAVPSDSVQVMMGSYEPRVRALRELAEEGLELVRDRPPPAGQGLRTMRDLCLLFEAELPSILERFNRERTPTS